MSRRSKGHAEEHPDERWVISYADLVTLLFGFFIILYATADANEVKMEALSRGLAEAFNVGVTEGDGEGSFFEGGSGIIPERNDAGSLDFDLERIRQLIEERSLEAGVQGQILVSRDEDRITIRLADNLVFPSASADIREQARPLLAIVAAAVNQTDNEIRVEFLGYSVAEAIHGKYVMSAALTGLGGGFMAISLGQVDPESMVNWTVSGELVFVTILSGPGSVAAPFIGSLIFELLRTYAFELAPHAWQLIVGGTLLLIIFFLPGGVWSVISRLAGRREARP